MSARPKLKTLNVSKNYITDKSCPSIAKMIVDCYTLAELYVKWNKITCVGATMILEA